MRNSERFKIIRKNAKSDVKKNSEKYKRKHYREKFGKILENYFGKNSLYLINFPKSVKLLKKMPEISKKFREIFEEILINSNKSFEKYFH